MGDHRVDAADGHVTLAASLETVLSGRTRREGLVAVLLGVRERCVVLTVVFVYGVEVFDIQYTRASAFFVLGPSDRVYPPSME